MPPTVSINLCCYNSEKYLEETLKSIFAQTYKDWELVIVNDGSTDSTESIIKEYISQGYPIIYHFQKNHGLGYSRNEALKRSRGKYIAFIDHDDIWMPEKLEKQISLFEKDYSTGLVFSDAIYFSDKGRRFQLYGNKKAPSGKIFPDLLKNYYLCLGTVVLKKDALINIEEWFDERFSVAEEVDVFMRIAHHWKCDYADEPLVMYRMHEQSSTSLMPERFPQELELILEKLLMLDPNLLLEYKHEIEIMKANIQYGYAMDDFRHNRRIMVRTRLVPYLAIKKKLWIPYLFSFLPFSFYKWLLLHFSHSVIVDG